MGTDIEVHREKERKNGGGGEGNIGWEGLFFYPNPPLWVQSVAEDQLTDLLWGGSGCKKVSYLLVVEDSVQ